MNIETNIELTLKSPKGEVKKITYSFKDLLDKTAEDIYEDLEDQCTSSGCYNES